MARYLLVSSDEEIDYFSQLFRGNWPDDLVLVASNSAGMVACERARIPYTTLDCYSPRADSAIAVAHDHHGAKGETSSAFHNLGHTIDMHHALHELAVLVVKEISV